MLLRFSVENHLSIKERQELSLVASSLKDLESGLIDCALVPGGKLLPAAVIYGANASGKSNLISAFEFVHDAVLSSHTRRNPSARIPRRPYALDPNYAEKPSVFITDFVADGIHYQYGFEASDRDFQSEWLYSFPKNKRRVMFERAKGNEFKFGRMLRGHNRVIANLTRSNSLFLSAAAQNDHPQLSKMAGFFRSIIGVTVISIDYNIDMDEIDNRVIKFLADIGSGVVDYRKQEMKIPEKASLIREELNALLRKHLGQEADELETEDASTFIQLGHKGSEGKTVFFNLQAESSGTRRLLPLLARVFWALDEGTPLLVDELDASLHTHACEAIVSLFCSSETNPNGAQLIATTHDTNILHSPILRRDQVWFTEKNIEGATELYPLTDIRTRRGDNLEKGYLEGRYGGTPPVGLLSYVDRSSGS